MAVMPFARRCGHAGDHFNARWFRRARKEAGTLGEVVKLAEKESVPVRRVDRHELDRKLRGPNHQGAALECGPYPYARRLPGAG